MSDQEITKPNHPNPFHTNGDRWATEEHRTRLLGWAITRQGTPYIWGGKSDEGYDCSGFVVGGLVDGKLAPPSWLQTHNAARLYDELEPTNDPQPMDACFYGPPGHIDHVMLLWHDFRTYGACGGNQHTTTAELAKKIGACVRFRPSVQYRSDFRGYRKLPEPK